MRGRVLALWEKESRTVRNESTTVREKSRTARKESTILRGKSKTVGRSLGL